MNDLYIPAGVKSAHDPHMAVAGIKRQIAGNSLAPGDIRTVAVLRRCPAAVAYDVAAAADVIEHPVGKPAAIQPVWPHRPCAGTACGPDLRGRPPAGVPAQDEAFPAPEVVDFPQQLVGGQDDLSPLLAEIVRQAVQNLLYLLNRERQVLAASNQGLEQLLVFRLQQLLQAGCRSRRSGGHRG